MTTHRLLILTLASLSLSFVTHAQVGLFQYGESTTYTDVGRTLEMEDGTTDATATDIARAFNTTDMSPDSPNYFGPEFFGGWGFADGTGEVFDFSPQISDDQLLAGNNDGPFFTANRLNGTAETFGFLMMSEIAETNYGDLATFEFAASRDTGSGNSAGARAVIRVGSTYYIGTNETTFSAYSTQSLDYASLETYDPTTNIVYAAGTPTVLSSTDVVDAVGVYFERRWTDVAGDGNARFAVGKINVTGTPINTGDTGSIGFITVSPDAGVVTVSFKLTATTDLDTPFTMVPDFTTVTETSPGVVEIEFNSAEPQLFLRLEGTN